MAYGKDMITEVTLTELGVGIAACVFVGAGWYETRQVGIYQAPFLLARVVCLTSSPFPFHHQQPLSSSHHLDHQTVNTSYIISSVHQSTHRN